MRINCVGLIFVFLLGFSFDCFANIESGVAAYNQKNYKEALRIFKPLADEKNTTAIHYMGRMYFSGEGVIKDRSKAVDYWKQSSALGYRTSIYNMGIVYKFGYAVPKNIKEALAWFEKAQEMGSTSAMYQIGKLHRDGHLGITDLSRARIWFEKAARKGKDSAMNDLAVMYEKGTGAPKDITKAYAWFKLAAEKGHKKAPQNFSITKNKMTGAQVIAGEELFTQLQASQPQPVSQEMKVVQKPPKSTIKPKKTEPKPRPKPEKEKSKPVIASNDNCFPNLDKALQKGLEICAQSKKPQQRKWCEQGCEKGAIFFDEFKKTFEADPSDPRSVCLQTIRAYRWKTSEIKNQWEKNGMEKLEAYYKEYGMKVYSQAVQKIDNVNQ